MTPDRWERVQEVFAAATEREPGSRAAFLEEACRGDPELRKEVESLLSSLGAASSGFLESPAIDAVPALSPTDRKAGSPALTRGARLGPYEIFGPLGAGGMGEVYRARDTKLDRNVAIKVLPESVAADPDALARFEREAKAVAALSHPNILAIHDFGSLHGVSYAVMELLEGQTLRRKLDAARVPQRQAVDYALQIARGLSAAHEKGVVHRDLKPENLCLTRDGLLKILDFGLAKRVEATAGEGMSGPAVSRPTEPGTVMGTVGYMAPEQVRGLPVDHRSDIFSFGAILYEMLSGKRAFKRDTAADTMSAILKEDPPDLSITNQNISPGLERIVRHCLEKNPEQRFQSARDLAFDLEALSGSSAARSAPGGIAAARLFRRRPIVVTGALAATAIGIALLLGRQLGFRQGARHSAGIPKSFRQLTNWSGQEGNPDLFPDGQTFVYTCDRAQRHEAPGNADIWSQRVGGQVATNLTKDCAKEEDYFPAFSPDGNLIAYNSDCRGGGIFLMGASGENPRRLTNFGFNPAWFPDGKRIVFSTLQAWKGGITGTGKQELWTADVATGKTAKLLDGVALAPAVSPHAFRIAFFGVPEGGSQRDIWTIPARGLAAGEKPVPVTQDAAIDWDPIWSPDGRLIYFLSDRNGTQNLWRISIDEESGRPQGQPEPMTLPGREIWQFRIARDGKQIIYMSHDFSCRLERLGLDAERGTATASGTEIFGGTTYPQEPVVSRDGLWIVFRAGAMQEDLYIARTDGSELRKLTDDAWRDRRPAFSPDGTTVAFQSDRSGRWEIWTIAADGSALTQLTHTTGDGAIRPAWSPDGRFLSYNGLGTGTELLPMSGARAAGPPEPLAAPGPGLFFVESAWSPDGTRLIGQAWRSEEPHV